MGEPKKASEIMVTLGIKIPPRIEAEIQRLADEDDRSKSNMARNLLLVGLEEYNRKSNPSPASPLTRDGLLAKTFDEEVKRIASEEGREISEIVYEIAVMIDVTTRQVYNWRSGKWPIPATVLPRLARHFKSDRLMKELDHLYSDASDHGIHTKRVASSKRKIPVSKETYVPENHQSQSSTDEAGTNRSRRSGGGR
jgi:hypothetical protein